MAFTLNHLYESAEKSFRLKCVAGKNGMDTMIRWVHLIEDVSTTDFLRGNELIITTGLRYEGSAWLCNFINELINKNAKGMIINTGRYIHEIPEEVLNYCEQMNFPLFKMPWEIHLEDVMQSLIHQLFQAENKAMTVAQALKKALLRPENPVEYLPILQEMGYSDKGNYTVVIMRTFLSEAMAERERILKQMSIQLSNLFTPYRILYDSVDYQQDVILIFRDARSDSIKENCDKVIDKMKQYFPRVGIQMAIGPKVGSIQQLYKSFQRGLSAMKTIYQNEKGLGHYDKLGIEKIIFEIQDKELLRDIVDTYLGVLIQFDMKHQTNYIEVLRTYLFNEGSLNAVADKMMTHRNTVHYRMNKIRHLLGNDLTRSGDRLNYQMAYYIYDDLMADKIGLEDQ